MLYTEAMALHKSQYFDGKNKNKNKEEYVFPYNFLHQDEEFVAVKIPTKMIETQETDKIRVNKYKGIIKEQGDMGPAWVSFGKKLQDGTIVRYWHMKFYAVDGNHRTEAYRQLNKKEIEVIMPRSHYTFFKGIRNE